MIALGRKRKKHKKDNIKTIENNKSTFSKIYDKLYDYSIDTLKYIAKNSVGIIAGVAGILVLYKLSNNIERTTNNVERTLNSARLTIDNFNENSEQYSDILFNRVAPNVISTLRKIGRTSDDISTITNRLTRDLPQHDEERLNQIINDSLRDDINLDDI